MPENIKYTVRLFADDTIVYLTITADVDRVHLQEDLDRLTHWQAYSRVGLTSDWYAFFL
jgi:hypothetical protein